MAGELVSRLLAESKSKVIPVDSEHSAIYQCLVGEKRPVNKLIITASGGPFRTMDSKHIARMTAREEPCCTRAGRLGAKITIDSATMLNKAFEIIEARWPFRH